MPNTYIGEFVEVTNAIVAGNRLIHVDTGTIVSVTDTFLLASINRPEIRVQVRDVVDRVIGAALLLASLWLWPIALIAAMAANPRKPLCSKRLVGNRKLGSTNIEFKAFEFATPVPLLRYLPYLLAVVSGHLRLVGVEPLEAGRATGRTEEWELVRDHGKAGLFGPVQLTATPETPAEERTIIEVCYIRRRSIVEDLKWILQAAAAVTSGRAWRPARPPVTLNGQGMHRAKSAEFAKDSRGNIEVGSVS